LKKTKLSFRVQFAGHTDIHALTSPSEFKQIKPEGGDFVMGALGAAGLKLPERMKTMASLGISPDRWCVPSDAGDGTATVEAEIMSAFLSAAANAAPNAAQDFRTRIAAQPPLTRALGLLILRSAGYDISSVLNALSAEDQQKFLSLTSLQDPYDLTPTRDLFQHLDMMWAVFEATGEFKPMKTIASTLSCKSD